MQFFSGVFSFFLSFSLSLSLSLTLGFHRSNSKFELLAGIFRSFVSSRCVEFELSLKQRTWIHARTLPLLDDKDEIDWEIQRNILSNSVGVRMAVLKRARNEISTLTRDVLSP